MTLNTNVFLTVFRLSPTASLNKEWYFEEDPVVSCQQHHAEVLAVPLGLYFLFLQFAVSN